MRSAGRSEPGGEEVQDLALARGEHGGRAARAGRGRRCISAGLDRRGRAPVFAPRDPERARRRSRRASRSCPARRRRRPRSAGTRSRRRASRRRRARASSRPSRVNALQDVEPAEIGHVDVEHGEVGPRLQGGGERLAPGASPDPHSSSSGRGVDAVRDREQEQRVVVRDQHAQCRPACSDCSCLGHASRQTAAQIRSLGSSRHAGHRRVHTGQEKVICCWEVDGVLVDPGPGVTEETLLAALGGERPRALLLTHIHFDHAGVSGSLVRRWPDLPVYVHERGAPHMVDPRRLMACAGRLYGGEEGLRALWGEMVPMPEENLRVLEGGERTSKARSASSTRPATPHTTSRYFHEPSGWAFVGDMAGARIPPHTVHRGADAAAGHRRRRLGALDRDDPRVEAHRPRDDPFRPCRGRRPPARRLPGCPSHSRSSSRRRAARPGGSRGWARAPGRARPRGRHDGGGRRRWTSSTWGWPAGARSSAAN